MLIKKINLVIIIATTLTAVSMALQKKPEQITPVSTQQQVPNRAVYVGDWV